MQQLHERMLAGVMSERRRLTRRNLLGSSMRVAGSTALVLSLSTAPAAKSPRWVALAQGSPSDLEVLTYALTLERLTFAFYRDGLDELSFGNDSRGASIDANLETIRDHEEDHIAALVEAITELGGEPVAEVAYDFGGGFDDPAAFLATAMALENTVVSGYDGAAQFLTDAGLLTTLATIVAIEARHASYLNLLNGELPFPAPFEIPLVMEDVLGIVEPFIIA